MRPRIVVFMGGQEEHAKTSRESGSWVCQYIPRSKYDVTPVEVTASGEWKVPIGTLPKHGSIGRTIEMLWKATPPQDPKKALERLLDKEVDSVITLLREKGGDDGALHSMGDMLGIRVAGSGRNTSDTAFHKHRFSQALSGIVATPYSLLVRSLDTVEDTAKNIWSDFIAPFFVKPVHGAGSHGVVKVHTLPDLHRALTHAKAHNQDVLVQEYLPGLELSVTVYKTEDGKLHTLPPTLITPKFAQFYDYEGKQSNGAHFHPVHESDKSLVHQAQGIAQEVYESLGCDGITTVDMIANDGAIDVLELNTIPSFHSSSPIHHQLKHAGVHPEHLLTGLLHV